jgi:tectonin beta-propeller repeat-containing protein 1
VFGEDDFVGSQYIECDITWIGVAAGAVTVDSSQLPNWFNDAVDDSQAELTKPWRIKILEDLKTRNGKLEEFQEFEKAAETSSWVKSGEVRIARVNGTFEDCLIELEWVSSVSSMDSGTFTVLNADGVSTKMQFSLSEITCVMSCSEPGHPRLAIHAPRLPVGLSPLKLQFSGDSELEDWLSHLTSVTCKLNDVHGRPSNDSIWATTSHLGEVFAFDPTSLREQQRKDGGGYSHEIDVSATETPYLSKLPNGMPIGSVLKITGCVYDDADQIRFDLQAHAVVRLRHKSEYFRNMPLHINPRFHERCVVLNSMEMSNWETEFRDTRNVFSPGKEFE